MNSQRNSEYMNIPEDKTISPSAQRQALDTSLITPYPKPLSVHQVVQKGRGGHWLQAEVGSC